MDSRLDWAQSRLAWFAGKTKLNNGDWPRAGLPGSAFLLLVFAYVARPLAQMWRSDLAKSLLQRRKYFGLGFAAAHTIHLFALVMFFVVSGEVVDPIAIIGGGGGYLLMFAMALTSNRAAMQTLGKWWKRLHRLGIHILWGIFLVTYIGRLQSPDTQLLGIITVGILLIAGVIRLAAWIKMRRSKKPGPT